ncbi:hypothetical protein ACQEVF_25245 [Nonomuraea polychroma]|uniref:hypothetical protein n=1 Tax=Nonomuraea polychroma TaxID=46176 RepID=UPI003D89D1E7
MSDETFEVKKISFHMPISEELAMEYGLIPDTRPPVRIPWRRRIHWRIQEAIAHARLRLGARIAGVHPQDWE